MFFREDDIGAEEGGAARGRRCDEIGSGEIGMENVARGRRGALYCTAAVDKAAAERWPQ
jgi:hypothetical protein